MVYEDDPISLVERYSHLNENHEVYVHFAGLFARYLNKKGLRNLLKESGFDLKKVKSSFDEVDWFNSPPEADIYFTDGLGGECFDILERLPKERSFLYSGNVVLQKTAKKRGYELVTNNLEKILRETLSG